MVSRITNPLIENLETETEITNLHVFCVIYEACNESKKVVVWAPTFTTNFPSILIHRGWRENVWTILSDCKKVIHKGIFFAHWNWQSFLRHECYDDDSLKFIQNSHDRYNFLKNWVCPNNSQWVNSSAFFSMSVQ